MGIHYIRVQMMTNSNGIPPQLFGFVKCISQISQIYNKHVRLLLLFIPDTVHAVLLIWGMIFCYRFSSSLKLKALLKQFFF